MMHRQPWTAEQARRLLYFAERRSPDIRSARTEYEREAERKREVRARARARATQCHGSTP